MYVFRLLTLSYNNPNFQLGIPLRYRQDYVTESPVKKRSREERRQDKKRAQLEEQEKQRENEMEEHTLLTRRSTTYYQVRNMDREVG